MALRSPEAFRQSLRDDRVVYFRGERVKDVTQHPVLRIGVETAAVDYQISEDPNCQGFAVVQLEDGEPVSRYLVPPRNAEDLLKRRQLVEAGSRICFGFPPFAKEGGTDALHAIAITTQRVDKALGTQYAPRVAAFRRHLQQGDLSLAIAMTDVKGDRSLRPFEQADPDLYLRKVKESRDGIVVRGAKAHITSAPYTNEILVLPTRTMTEADRDYALAFALPVTTPGLTIIARPTGAPGGPDEYPVSSRADIIEGLVVFEDVFIPWERVFLNGEWQFAGLATHMFANFHRVTASAYKYPFAELLVGAALLMAEANGIDRIPHVREKIAWLVYYAETIAALSRAACEHPVVDADSGIAYPDPILGNAAKFFFADNYHQVVKMIQDIGGGILVTAPSTQDYENPALRPLIEKYLAGKAEVPASQRLRVIKLVKDLVASDMGGFWEVLTIHGEGSLAAEKLAIYGAADFERYRGAARRAAGLSGEPWARHDS